MKLYFEEYQYPLNLLQDNLGDEVNLSRQNDKANIPYVGYYYNAKINDTVFILPKVFISENGKAFDRYNPEDIIDRLRLKGDELKFNKERGSNVVVRDYKIRRNEQCPCGSGKKYKHCCLASGKYETTHTI